MYNQFPVFVALNYNSPGKLTQENHLLCMILLIAMDARLGTFQLSTLD